MDGTNPRNEKWIEKEKKELIKANVTFRHLTLNTDDKKTMNNILDSIVALPKPVVIHQWNTHGYEMKHFRKIFSQKTGSTTLNLATNVPESY
jgi:hypothetical protein